MEDIFSFLEAHFAKGNKYISGDSLTIADLLIFEEATNVELYNFDLSKWAKVKEWYDLVLENEAVKQIHLKFR